MTTTTTTAREARRNRDRLIRRYWTLVDRYNREYRAGLWTTNRPLDNLCVEAYEAALAAGWDGSSRA